MTTIVVDELVTTLSQNITLNSYRNYHIAGLKLRLLMYNAPAGTFTVSIKSGANTLSSYSFTSADIKTELNTTDNYAHLYKVISIPYTILKSGSYEIELSSSGYTYAFGSFIGWVKSYENIFNEREDSLDDITNNPFDILVYEKIREDLSR